MADEAKHTTGPWSVHVETEQHGMYRGTSAVYICSEAGWPDGQLARVNVQDGLGEREANAHLLAAAPKLLAAVRALIGDVRWLKTGIANRVECAHCGRQYDETKDETLPDFCDDECPGEIGRAAIAKAANT